MNILVSLSDMKTSSDTKAVLIAHSLGSCIGIVLYDPVIQTGGILHFMLPSSKLSPVKAQNNPYMFADTGIAKFLDTMYQLGAKKENLKVAIAGAAEIMGQIDFLNIGKSNYIATKSILKQYGLKVDFEDTGKNINRTLKLEIKKGLLYIIITGQEEKKICMK